MHLHRSTNETGVNSPPVILQTIPITCREELTIDGDSDNHKPSEVTPVKIMSASNSSLLRLISDTFSIRGVPRLSRGPRFLRGLWLCFVISMTVGLCLTSYYLVQDYLLYDVAVNVHVALDAHSPFPALTVCHHHPFSAQAYEMWRQGKMLSPNTFNRRMRNLTQYYLDRKQIDLAEHLYHYDSVSIYYQNILTEDAYRLGHNTSIFLNCIRRVKQSLEIEDDCTRLEGFQIRQFSHHTFFNCHTLEPKDQKDAEATDMLALIVSLGPKPDYRSEEQAFLIDLFEMARGLRVVVHEPGTYPDLEREGLHVEPGKLNEINYAPVMWERLNTPPHPCREDWLDRSYELAKITSEKLPASPSTDYAYAYSDLNVSYRYSQVQCILLHQQLDIIDKCHCQYVFNPRPRHPNSEVPYCGRILDNDTNLLELIMQRIECLSGGPLNNSLKRHYEATSCFPRCSYYTYDSTISVTTWRAVDWQLHWLRQLNNAFKAMRHDQSTKGENWPVNRSKGYAKWIEYYEKTNLTNIPQNAIQDLNLEGNNFAYVVLKRRSGDVKVNKEKLVLSISVLLSRIGGLCSLTIGLTAAFVVEMIEFAYLLCTNKKTNTEKCTMKNNCKRSKSSPTTNPIILINKPTSTMNQSESLLRPGPLSAADDSHDFELGDSNG